MLTKILTAIVMSGALWVAGDAAHQRFDCCPFSGVCCNPPSECCSTVTAVKTGDCCSTGDDCCTPPSDCCSSATSAKKAPTKSCCSESN